MFLEMSLIKFPEMVDAGEVESGVKLQLMVLWFHIGTEFIKGFIVLFLFEMGQLMYNDHP